MKRVLVFFKQINKPSWMYLLLLLMALNVFWGTLIILEPEILRRGTAAVNGRDLNGLWSAAGLAAAAAVILIAVNMSVSMLKVRVQNQGQFSLIRALAGAMADMRKRTVEQYKFGDVSTVVITNSLACSKATINMMINFAQGVMAMGAALIYMAVIEWRLALCIVVYHIIYRLAASRVLGKLKRNTAEVIEAEKDSGNLLSSLLSNMLSVRMATNKEFFDSMVRKKESKLLRKSLQEYTWSNGLFDSMWASGKFAEFVIIYGIGALVLFPGEAPLGTLLAFIFAEDIFNCGTNWFNVFLSCRAEALAHLESLLPFYNSSEKEQGALTSVEGGPLSIRFSNVSFGYGNEPVIKNASFTIAPGEKVLIKGGNGQGKSTLLKLIAGLYRPDSGTIFYGDTDTSAMHLDSLNGCYSYISQLSNILDGDTRRNIALSSEFDHQTVNEILSGLNMAKCAETPPANLSQGERQRLNIGRALYKSQPGILIGDEIFANIDKENRDGILKLIQEHYKNHTVIMIAHEDMNYPFDRVLVVGGGTVQESVAA